jgi:hypothetical protein
MLWPAGRDHLQTTPPQLPGRNYRRPPVRLRGRLESRRYQWPAPTARVVARSNNVVDRVPFSLGNGSDTTLTKDAQKSLFRAFPVTPSGGLAPAIRRSRLQPRT